MDYPTWRRIVEVLLVLFALPFALTLGLLTSIAVAIDSPGGVFFVQTRPGKLGRPFRMVKFRTMTAKPTEEFRLTAAKDPRLTRVGRWLRATHLDETPQLWHVLKGEMSLIGPRPVPMELYNEYLEKIPNYDARHSVAPGITGLAQVCLGYTNTLDGEREKWGYDVYGITRRGLALDVWIIWATTAKLLGISVNTRKIASKVTQYGANKNAP